MTTISRPCHRLLDPGASPALAPRDYWNARATRFAASGDGLAAVCSFGMPPFYNRYIDVLQRRALRQWLDVPRDARILDIGCGVGRWSRHLATAGHRVVGFDLSPTMIADARRRARQQGVEASCRLFVADSACFSLGGTFDFILGVTVLQHILDDERWAAAIGCMSAHLAPKGRAVLLEAAPTHITSRNNSPVFVAREEQRYLDAFRRAGLRVVAVRGVDPAPFRMWLLPWFRSIARPLAAAGMLAATLAGAPIDFLSRAGHRDRSWHKVFVLEREEDARS